MRGLYGAIMLAACTDGGLVVRVDPNGIAVDEVRLFVGVGDGSTTQLQPPPQGLVYPTADGLAFWSRDPHNAGDHSAVTDAKPARFVFASDGGAAVLPAMIAVGYKDGLPIAAASRLDWVVPDTDFGVYTLTLSERVPDLAVPPGGGASFLFDFQVWSPAIDAPADEAACVGIQDNREAPVFPSGFIVTDDDRDCDGAKDDDPGECDKDIYHSSRPPTRDELTCTTVDAGSCLLGGPACVDGESRDATGCSATQYCASSKLCEVCSGIACASDITPLLPSSLPLHIACVIHALPDGAFCGGGAPLPPLQSTVGCTDAAIRSVETGFGTELVYDAMKLTLDRPDGVTGCDMTLVPSGTAGPLDRELAVGALLAVDLDNGHGLAVPMFIRVRHDGCAEPSGCTVIAAQEQPSLAACAGLL